MRILLFPLQVFVALVLGAVFLFVSMTVNVAWTENEQEQACRSLSNQYGPYGAELRFQPPDHCEINGPCGWVDLGDTEAIVVQMIGCKELAEMAEG